MDYIVNGNHQIVVETKKRRKQPVLSKDIIQAYSKKLHNLQVKGGKECQK